ncbi:hypothetical protein KP509_1Z178200 [Ceratopteris richardii]|nr:hypothetical protein KP509_1Z178200 [Ceratopteris richardii]
MGLPAVTKATLRSSVSDGDPHETDHTIHQTCRHVPDTTQVIISKTDLIAAILEKSSTENVSSVYIATDGWLRGQRAQTLVKEVGIEVSLLRQGDRYFPYDPQIPLSLSLSLSPPRFKSWPDIRWVHLKL